MRTSRDMGHNLNRLDRRNFFFVKSYAEAFAWSFRWHRITVGNNIAASGPLRKNFQCRATMICAKEREPKPHP